MRFFWGGMANVGHKKLCILACCSLLTVVFTFLIDVTESLCFFPILQYPKPEARK